MLTKLARLFRHRWSADALRRQVPPELLARLEYAVQRSERQHSGEIRIIVEAGLPVSYLWRNDALAQITRQRALALFGKLRVWDTAHNNGVLIYLLLAERSIEIVADRGLNDKVEPATWQELIVAMRSAFQTGDFDQGLTLALARVGALLTAHFPIADSTPNPNELPNAPILR